MARVKTPMFSLVGRRDAGNPHKQSDDGLVVSPDLKKMDAS
jgi:hypothetical protein